MVNRRGVMKVLALSVAVAFGGLASSGVLAQQKTVKVGVLHSLSGTMAISETVLKDVALMTFDEINAKGGVMGRKIEIVTYDNKSSSADSVRAFQRAVSEDKVSAVIASYISEVVLALEPWAARLKMPLITPGAANSAARSPSRGG
jgi:branched-chain amino acid transport system substrate-binding protein